LIPEIKNEKYIKVIKMKLLKKLTDRSKKQIKIS